MSKFISVKVFRGSFPEDKEIGQFAGKRGACFRVATEDDAHVKCFHVSEPPFDADHLEDLDRIKSLVFAYLMFQGIADMEVELLGAELVAEYKMTEAENRGVEIERIK
ncbi:hypothetical protein PM308_13080 [Escherichia coli]|jgi:hypothetical protein|uniref:hypothetical protein n=1 Tax=Escherichia coli TaxID=562 RepID=UPI000A903342|nr:hypothetical protein [Escherichia coli]EIH7479344.1 hypothetical protein [Escherichia coli]EIY8184732.1 hypothetical protein [Escherichia coli]MDB7141835.1 hypothetical protein [Escherichia coli]MDB7151724.1 hypothetical protein [Escherichia coli]MDB7156873.1 hypothetical protein [Escherichia coli]